MDKVDSTLFATGLTEMLIKETFLHHNLVKYDVKDIDDALFRAEVHSA